MHCFDDLKISKRRMIASADIAAQLCAESIACADCAYLFATTPRKSPKRLSGACLVRSQARNRSPSRTTFLKVSVSPPPCRQLVKVETDDLRPAKLFTIKPCPLAVPRSPDGHTPCSTAKLAFGITVGQVGKNLLEPQKVRRRPSGSIVDHGAKQSSQIPQPSSSMQHASRFWLQQGHVTTSVADGCGRRSGESISTGHSEISDVLRSIVMLPSHHR